MFRFNKNAALAGDPVTNGYKEEIFILEENPGFDYPLRDQNATRYTEGGRFWKDKTDKKDLVMNYCNIKIEKKSRIELIDIIEKEDENKKTEQNKFSIEKKDENQYCTNFKKVN